MSNFKISPFIKWAGGKRQLLEEIKDRFPKQYKRYYEPFVGGGAVLFEISPKKASINDINPYLIHAYKTIRDDVFQLIKKLKEIDGIEFDKEKYYSIRDAFNDKIEKEQFDLDTAALFIALNKRCFNGLFRVNAKGLFNVPFNGKVKANSFDEENLIAISKYLKKITIRSVDFEKCARYARKGDFVFFDSPYAPLNPTSFEAYTKEGFSEEEHKRLASLYKKLDKKGCYLMLTNHNTEFIRSLYEDYQIDVVQVKRMINSDAAKRTGEEVIITNYDWRK